MLRPALACFVIVATLAIEGRADARPQRDKRVCLEAYESGQRMLTRHAIVQSIAALRTCAKETCPAVLRRDCAGWLVDAERKLPTTVLVARGPDGQDDAAVAIFANDKRLSGPRGEALSLDPGTYHFRFEHAPYAPVERTVVLAEGEKGRRIEIDFAPLAQQVEAPAPVVDLRPEAPAAFEPSRPLPWIFAGTALTSLGVGGYLLYRGNDQKNALERCKPTCEEGRVDDARLTVVTADVLLGVGVVSAVTAAVLFASGRSQKTEPLRAGRTAVQASATTGGLSVTAVGEF